MRLVFAHGWGFDRTVWKPLRAALGDPAAEADDRGYFSEPRAVAPGDPFVAVGHSLGALRLALAPPAGCVAFVGINGFDRFCGEGGVATRVVDRMIARLDREPAETVRDFRDRCGDAGAFGPPDSDRLRADLLLLRDGDARGAALPHPLLLDGDADPILAPGHRAIVFAGRPRETMAGGGHLLPLSHPAWCAARIRAHVAAL